MKKQRSRRTLASGVRVGGRAKKPYVTPKSIRSFSGAEPRLVITKKSRNPDNKTPLKLLWPRPSVKGGSFGVARLRNKNKIKKLGNKPTSVFKTKNLNKYLLTKENKKEEIKLIVKRMPKMPGAGIVNKALEEGVSTKTPLDYSITDSMYNGTNPGRRIIPVKIMNKEVNGPVLANIEGPRKVFKTIYETGFTPTKAVRILAKQNGVTVKTLSDSKIDFKSSDQRNVLTQGQGFNEVLFHVPPGIAHVSANEVRQECVGVDEVEDNINKITNTRFLVMNIKNQFLIKNNATNLALEFKIHLVKINRSDFHAEYQVQERIKDIKKLKSYIRSFEKENSLYN